MAADRTMLCGSCQKIWARIDSGLPCDKQTAEPSLFEYAQQPNTWTGSHHTSDGSFVSAVQDNCYICTTIERDCTRELRKQAALFRTFYQLQSTDNPDQDGRRYDLDFTVEILRGQPPIPQRHVFDCSGIFKILPKQGMFLIRIIWWLKLIERVAISVPMNPLPITKNTFSTACEKLVRRWLEDCCKCHKHCTQRFDTTKSSRKQLLTGYPTRILNISAARGEKFSLELSENLSKLPEYVTLSHCWNRSMPLKLETGNIDELKAGMPLSKLSKRFQDAVKIARWMGIDYIWIDALCIIQNSKSDWVLEASRMGEIYSNSYCNIAATSSEENKGCFTDRPRELVEPCAVSDPLSDDPEKTHILGYNDFWCNSLLDTALHNRGWVIQERLLSPRTIHFGQEQIFWECREIKACEAYPEGIPEAFCDWRTRAWGRLDEALIENGKYSKGTMAQQHPSFLQRLCAWLKGTTMPMSATTAPSPGLPTAYEFWSRTVERYMECKLTYQQDKLVAISGIARKIQEATGERYLAGLWDNSSLAPSLLWYVLGRRQADSTASVRYRSVEDDCRAPSWSWASMEAKIVWHWPVGCESVLIKISGKEVNTTVGTELTGVASAKLHIEGHLSEAKLRIAGHDQDGYATEDGCYALQLKSQATSSQQITELEPAVFLDTPLLPDHCVDVHLLPVCTGWNGLTGDIDTQLSGLVLKKVTCRFEAKYERIGIFGLDQTQAYLLYGLGSEKTNDFNEYITNLERSVITIV